MVILASKQALVKTESLVFVLHPAQWKIAEIILILKPGQLNELTTYLPTRLTHCI
jgi:hypothetical protein